MYLDSFYPGAFISALVRCRPYWLRGGFCGVFISNHRYLFYDNFSYCFMDRFFKKIILLFNKYILVFSVIALFFLGSFTLYVFQNAIEREFHHLDSFKFGILFGLLISLFCLSIEGFINVLRGK